MKKLFTLALVVFNFQAAMAMSPKSEVLHFDRVNKTLSANPNHALSVYVDGTVVHRYLSPQLPGGVSNEVIAHLSAAQMDRIERLVARSTPARKVFERSHIMCFLASVTVDEYSADNGRVFLKKGAACDGGFEVNNRPAARKLVNILETLEAAAHKKANLAEVESQVEALLD